MSMYNLIIAPCIHHHLIRNSYIHLLMHPLLQHLLSISSSIYPATHASIHSTIYPSSVPLAIIHPFTHHPNIHHLPTLQPIIHVSDGDEDNRLGFSREVGAEVLKPLGLEEGETDPENSV